MTSRTTAHVTPPSPILVARISMGDPAAIFGFGLRRAREAAGMTQARLGARVGQTALWAGRVERGDKRVDAATMRALAEAVGCGMDALVRRPEREAG